MVITDYNIRNAIPFCHKTELKHW